MHTSSTSTALDESKPLLMSHFDDLEQQHNASNLGMWFFLATEVMFFSGLIAAYTVYRALSPVEFHAASRHMNKWLGFGNTLVLLSSSLTMAMAVRESQLGNLKRVYWFLVATAVLGAAFLGVKAFEYSIEINHHLFPGPHFQIPAEDLEHMQEEAAKKTNYDLVPGRFQMMFVLYFFMTGVHAFHMIIGIAAVLIMAWLVRRRWFSGYGTTQIEVMGLYWHFVDVVWVFLYPLLYLID
jgi:cytochrome c oxidase subunit 3